MVKRPGKERLNRLSSEFKHLDTTRISPKRLSDQESQGVQALSAPFRNILKDFPNDHKAILLVQRLSSWGRHDESLDASSISLCQTNHEKHTRHPISLVRRSRGQIIMNLQGRQFMFPT